MNTPDNLRELLELAALAVGLEGYSYENTRAYTGLVKHDFSEVTDEGFPLNSSHWNPASNSGDGAEMEAALKLAIGWFDDAVLVSHRSGGIAYEFYRDHSGDKQAARRMASLRVAAAVGRAMKESK